MIINKCIEWSLNCWSKIPCRSPTMSEILSPDFVATCIAMSSQERQIGAYSIGLTIWVETQRPVC